MMKKEPILVAIECAVYNHEPYLRDCLEGFVMQKTNFRFVAIVHDDCSTDGSVGIIREYTEKYPDIFLPIYETENQYSKHDGSLDRIMNDAITATGAKYVAICEGDDYWTDPMKLQKQVDFLETHPNHSLCIHAYTLAKYNGQNDNPQFTDVRKYKNDIDIVPTQDVIRGKGMFCATASMVYKREAVANYPQWAYSAPVGDRPLQLVLFARGHIAYLNNIMSVYRVGTPNSWTSRVLYNPKEELAIRDRFLRIYLDFDNWSMKKYHSYIQRAVIECKIKWLRKDLSFVKYTIIHFFSSKHAQTL